MSKHIYSREEIDQLATNEHVVNCSERSITFSTAFKELAVRQYEDEGLTPREIFQQVGIDLDVIGWDAPGECIKRWRRIVRNKGVKGLTESRGSNGSGRPKTKFDSDKEKMEYMEAEVAYLKAENAFLKKLRAKRRAE